MRHPRHVLPAKVARVVGELEPHKSHPRLTELQQQTLPYLESMKHEINRYNSSYDEKVYNTKQIDAYFSLYPNAQTNNANP